MTSGSDIITMALMFQYLFIGELVIFSICLLMIQVRTRAVYIWLLSNAVAILASLHTLQYISSGWKTDNSVAAALMILSSTLKALSFADRGFTRKINRIPSILIIISFILTVLIFVLGETVFRLFLVAISSAFLSLSAIFYLIHNKNWIGLPSLKYCVAILGLSALVCIYSLLIS